MARIEPWGGLGRRIFAAFLAVSLVPLALAALLTYWRSASVMEAYVVESVEKTARAYASDLDRFVERQRQRLRDVPLDDAPLPDVLRRSAPSDAHLDALLLVDETGTVLDESESDLEAWVLDACAALVADPTRPVTHAGRGHAHQVVVGVPREEGVLCGRVNFTLHQDMLTERASGALGGTAFIVDRSGTVVCHSFETDEPQRGRGDQLGDAARGVADQDGLWSGRVDEGAAPVLAAFAPASTLPWGVWVEVSQDVAAAPLRTGLAQTLAVAALLALAATGAAVWLGRGLVTQISSDMASMERMQTRLVHQEKMAALGTLAAGLAHEIGNPLASLSSELQMMEQLWDADEARASVPVLRDQVRRMDGLLREFVDLGRPTSDHASTFAPDAVASEVARLLRHDPRSDGVHIEVQADATPQVCSLRDRLSQVLVNLGLNALDALEGTGHLQIRTQLDASGDGVRIDVVDDGPGIPAEVAEQVFDPFFTTKAPGKGTGLGLFVSERMVRAMGGSLELGPSGPASGGHFVVRLPWCGCGRCSVGDLAHG